MGSETPDLGILGDTLEVALHNSFPDVALIVKLEDISPSCTNEHLSACMDINRSKTWAVLDFVS